jgi:hypothetical protein
MILRENFSEEHIRELQKTSKRDPILLERTVYAFGLLEAITRVGMPFVFKGGTSLILLMDKPRRLSTDIDIIVAPGTDIDYYIDEAAKIFPFLRVEEQTRIGRNNIEKRHFKFTYDSHIGGHELYILLDVLFEDHHYEKLVERQIKNELLITEPEYMNVNLPSRSCVLGDKLTAFAPHTTGILLNRNKNMEIMKQFYDISTLLDEFENFEDVRKTYFNVVASEIGYRGIDVTADECLKDTYEAALCIASRGKMFPEDYPKYVKAIQDLRGHIYAENFSPEIAVGRAAKIIYAVRCLMNHQNYEKVEDYVKYMEKRIMHKELQSLKYLKKANPLGYAYIIKADEIME